MDVKSHSTEPDTYLMHSRLHWVLKGLNEDLLYLFITRPWFQEQRLCFSLASPTPGLAHGQHSLS